jgi:tyrosyl-tRNA synthetase
LRLMGKATLQQVLQREDFADRLKQGAAIGAHEILYPFSQAYDSVAVRADVELGGTDQLFNLLFGREIQKAYGQEPQDIAVFPLLEGPDGVQRMSKSLGNYIGINEPPEQIYGKTMSIPDALTEKYVRLISGLDAKQQAEVLAKKPRDAKAALARQLVKRLHREEAAVRAEDDFDRKFRQHELPVSVEEEHFPDARNVVDVLVETHIAKSRNEARRLIEGGGVRVDGQKVGPDYEFKSDAVLQVGKRNFVRIRLR